MNSRVFEEIETIRQRIKPNPNHYPIVDKWNYKYVYLPHRIELFESIVDYIYKKLWKV